jgi:CHAT domain-containing protein
VLSEESASHNLYARDIARTPLDARLVTISACDSAGTRTYSGEGLVGLSWAFLRAGAQEVIAALWEVNDASTAQLMDRLYAGIAAGESPADALRAAKLAMLRSDTIYRRPFYWAPFVIYSGSGGATRSRAPRAGSRSTA